MIGWFGSKKQLNGFFKVPGNKCIISGFMGGSSLRSKLD
jgi:hypothetical protein